MACTVNPPPTPHKSYQEDTGCAVLYSICVTLDKFLSAEYTLQVQQYRQMYKSFRLFCPSQTISNATLTSVLYILLQETLCFDTYDEGWPTSITPKALLQIRKEIRTSKYCRGKYMNSKLQRRYYS